MNQNSESQRPSVIRRFWQVSTSPYVIWGGFPTAIITAVWAQFDATGYVWSSLWSRQFLVRLVVNIAITGYGMGLLMRAVFRRAFAWLGISPRDGWQ
jgi:hypothetical protein